MHFRESVARPAADPGQWNSGFREEYREKEERARQASRKLYGSPRARDGRRVRRIYTDERRDVPETIVLPETPHVWSSVAIPRLIRDSGTGA